jgi:putative membrane-bound dehydrogenase-like protein
MRSVVFLLIIAALQVAIANSSVFANDDNTSTTGPSTEERFPPLTVPAGFKVTLFACDPLVEYPSVIAIGPAPGTLFVAHDYVTGLGVEIVRHDEIRILSDTDKDGYADTSQLYAGGFNSIQGLAYHDRTVFVMHAPRLTALEDTDGDGVADVRQDLLDGLGLPPEENSNRLHCANGVVVGHDGWLYLALGDRGCDVQRPEGDRLLFRAGGILRCRPDGRDLHVFSTGLRNIYDIALDAELNVFVRDNENDGGDYMIRVCHSFHGADHGYPYLYPERPAEGMQPLADLGRGSSAGGTSYLETAFPVEYRRSLFYCEWGRAVVRYDKQRSNGYFQPMKETDFAAGASSDPYGFKPTDLVVDHDGSLLVSDWCDGQRPKRGRGRIYRISAVGQPKPALRHIIAAATSNGTLINLLSSDSYHQRCAAQQAIERRVKTEGEQAGQLLQALRHSMKQQSTKPLGRLHGVWIIAHSGHDSSLDMLLGLAHSDPDPRVRAQAIRAVADLADPIFLEHKIKVGRGDPLVARRIADLANDEDPQVVLEILIALGRLRWSDAAGWLSQTWKGGDPAQSHAAMQLLRKSDNWPMVLTLLDRPDGSTPASPGLRTLVLRALGDRSKPAIVDGINQRLGADSDPLHRREYVDLLARVYKRPAPWVYWGFRPAPRPANTVMWERTALIEDALNRALTDSDRSVRKNTLLRMRREAVPIRFDVLAEWLRGENDSDHVSAILTALESHPLKRTEPLLLETIISPARDQLNRLSALALLERGLTRKNENRLLDLAGKVEDGPVLAAVLETIGKRPRVPGNRLLIDSLSSASPDVRSSALQALGSRNVTEAGPHIPSLLVDGEPQVRRAAARAAGILKVRDAAPLLLKTAASNDLVLRRVSLESLVRLKEPGAVSLAVDSLPQTETQLAALNYLRDFGTARELDAVAMVAATNRSVDVLVSVGGVLAAWLENQGSTAVDRERIHRALARLHGDSGNAIVWSIIGPLDDREAQSIVQRMTNAGTDHTATTAAEPWRRVIADGVDSVVRLASAPKEDKETRTWLASIALSTAQPAEAQFLTSVDGVLQVWLNGQSIFNRTKTASFRPNSDRFDGSLTAGTNRLLVKLASNAEAPRFHMRFRAKASKLAHERLTQRLLAGPGNVQRGRELFVNAEKSLCIKCHRLDDQGGQIGPDLTGIGSRFSRIHLIESILEPSRTIAPSYASTVVVLDSGKVYTGVKIAETAETITLGDAEGKSHTIPRAEIEELHASKFSIMPEGTEKRLTERELMDLIAFLISQKKTPR